jgi:hypothetical protein
VWREKDGRDGLVRLSERALLPGMVVVAKAWEPWHDHPELRWLAKPELLEPVDAAARLALQRAETARQQSGASHGWSAATSDDGFRRCTDCGALVRDNADLGYHCCHSNDD